MDLVRVFLYGTWQGQDLNIPAADLFYGGPTTDFMGDLQLLILTVGLLLIYFMGDRRLSLLGTGDC